LEEIYRPAIEPQPGLRQLTVRRVSHETARVRRRGISRDCAGGARVPLHVAGIVVGSLFIIALALVINRALGHRRGDTFQHVAGDLRMNYIARGTPFVGSDVTGLSPLARGAATVAHNILQGTLSGCGALIFELTHFGPSEISPLETTYAAFRAPGRLPVLHMGAKHTIDRLRERVHKDAHREFDPRFASEFFVFSSDPGLQGFVTPHKMDELLRHAHDYHIETSPDWLLVYRPGVKVPAKRLGQFIREACGIAGVLLSAENDRAHVPA
jgi:hypothetical protein